MAFIDKLLEGGLPYGMEIEEPKGDDKINRLIFDNDMQSIVQGLVMGMMGVGGGGKVGWEKGLGTAYKSIFNAPKSKLEKELVLAMKGKIKGGKMIPDQPFRQGAIGKPSKVGPLETYANKVGEAIDKTNKNIYGKPSIDAIKGKKYPSEAREEFPIDLKYILGKDAAVAPKGSGGGKAGLIGLLGLLGLADRSSDGYEEDAVRNTMIDKGSEFYDENIYSLLEGLIPDPDMSGARDINDDLMRLLREQTKDYEGDTPIGLEELAKIIQGEEEETINYPQHFSNRARSWAR